MTTMNTRVARGVLGIGKDRLQGILDAAAQARDSADVIERARVALWPSLVVARFIGKVIEATALDDNRYLYSGESALVAGTEMELVGDESGVFEDALNLREMNNTADIVDNTPLPDGASVGPVGSTWTGSSWTTTGLSAYVEVLVVYKKDGSLGYFINEQMPVICGGGGG